MDEARSGKCIKESAVVHLPKNNLFLRAFGGEALQLRD